MPARRWCSTVTRCSHPPTRQALPSSDGRRSIETMSGKLRVAVIGVGYLGQHHARLLSASTDVELVGVVDIKPGRPEEIAAKYATRPFTAARDVLGRVDAVTIAVPTVAHFPVAMTFIEQGVSVLIEKPLAASVDEADRLLEASDQHRVILAAGHTERFNPAVTAALPLVTDPRFVEIHRLGTFPER